MTKSSSGATASNDGATGRRHVAVCTFPFSSHAATLLLLARKIAASAPDAHVSFFTTAASAADLAATLPPEEGAAPVHVHRLHDGLPAGETSSPPEAMRRFAEAAGEALRRSLAEAEEAAGAEVSCLVADAFMAYVCRDIAAEKGVKWVALWTSAAAALAVHMYTDELRARIGGAETGVIEAHKEETLDRYIPGFPPIPVADLPPGTVSGDFSALIPRLLHTMSQTLSDASTIAMNTFDLLETDTIATLNTAFGAHFIGVGPCSITLAPTALAPQDPHGCLPWLDTHLQTLSSVVYISFGTVHTPPPHEFTALAEALEASKVAFLWSIPDRFTEYLPNGFQERTGRSGKGKLVSWAPQTSVLDHGAIGAQLTHCGWNSVLESVLSGVPMICRPMAIAEQVLNRRLVVAVWGIGVEVEGGKLTKVAAVRALERVLVEEDGRRAREKIQVMKKVVMEAVAEPGGSSARNLHNFINTIITS